MLIECNSHDQLAIEELARMVNLSPGRLAHLFKSEMDISIQQYLTQLRLAKAKDQLETSFLSVKEIAASVGFPSVTRFVGCFKSLIGATPAQYRKQLARIPYLPASAGNGSKIGKGIAENRTNSRI
jgi:transcriptional regulator GlxA family with amidase domain